jgi:hypothetical protein
MSPMTRKELLELVQRVRARWRMRVALQGLALVFGLGLLWLVMGAWVLHSLRFSAGAVSAFRVLAWVLAGFAVIRYVVLPLLRRVTDAQVARYIEEHEPGLEALLVSAVEQANASEPASTNLAEAVVRNAVARIRDADEGRRIEAIRLRNAAAISAGLAAVGVLGFLIGPTALRQAGRALIPWQDAAAATPYAVLVEPGNIAVPKGGDLEISARLRGFATDRVELLLREGDSPEWRRLPMISGDSSGAWGFRLFDLTAKAEYVVEANGVRSGQFTITIADLPAVERLALELRFPSYTGLAVERQDPGGDIAVPRGTGIRFMVTPTRPSPLGRVVTEAGDTIPLKPGSEGQLEGNFRASQSGWYRIELQAPSGEFVEGSLRYRIDLLDDVGPTVVFTRPGRDAQATAVEEVFAEARATDDYGIRKLELVYRVNGGEEKTISLYGDGAKRMPEVIAGHTFFLEELGLKPGDVIAYFARATDNGAGPGRTSASDIYFLRIRPFGKDYRAAEQAGMPGGAGQGDSPEGLSARQREIIAGTYKVQRDKAQSGAQQVREDLAILALTQGRLRERVNELVQQMTRRNAARMDSMFVVIQKELTDALPEMAAAEQQLGQRKADDALGPEQRALAHLQRAEEAFREVQVTQGQQQGGGGGQQSNSEAEDLADLFELETDKLQNQYETMERGEERQRQREMDETLERLKQLAQRQQREEASRRAGQPGNQGQQQSGQSGQSGQGGQSGQSGGQQQAGSSQRQLAQEAEELARRLERLTREQNNPEVAEAARRLQEAANAMRRSAASQSGGEGEARAAADRLREATRALERSQSAGVERQLNDAARRAQELADREREIGQDMDRALKSGQPDAETARRLMERKDSMAADVGRLERDLSNLGRETRGTRPDAGRRLEESARGIREDRVQDKIRFSKGLLRGQAPPDYAKTLSESIAANLDSAAARISGAGRAFAQSDSSGSGRALDRARDLVQGLESLRERMEAQQDGKAGGREGGRADTSSASSEGQRGQQQGGQQQGGQQQGGQQGGQQQGGQQPGQAGGRGVQDTTGGAPMQGENSAGGRPGYATPGGDARQWQRELRERRADAEALRAELEGMQLDPSELDRVIAEIKRLESSKVLADATGLNRLQADVLERLKAFEFALRRRIEGDAAKPLAGAGDQVPPRFRELVEEYYRSLAKSGKR